MRFKVTILSLIAVMACAFSYTRPHYDIPSDLRDAPSSEKALNALKAASRAAADEVPLPGVAQRDSEEGLLNPTRVQNSDCGPDVTIPLGNVIHGITVAYNSWPKDIQERNCDSMDVDLGLSAVGGWDIVDLRPDLYNFESRLLRGGECDMTVEVEGKCFRHEEVNYLMWGLMTQLCGKSLAWSEFKIRAYLRYHYLHHPHDTPFSGEADNKIAWTEAGYYGWPQRSGAPPPTRSDCTLSPGSEADFPPFRAQWNRTVISTTDANPAR